MSSRFGPRGRAVPEFADQRVRRPCPPCAGRSDGVSGWLKGASSTGKVSVNALTLDIRGINMSARGRCPGTPTDRPVGHRQGISFSVLEGRRSAAGRCLSHAFFPMTDADPPAADSSTRVDYVALAPGQQRRALRDPGRAGPRRLRHHLSGPRYPARSRCGAQGIPAGGAGRAPGRRLRAAALDRSRRGFQLGPRPLHRRGPHARHPARGAFHRAGVRLPRGERHRLHRHGAAARRDAGGAHQGRRPAVAGRAGSGPVAAAGGPAPGARGRASCIATSSPPTCFWARATGRP